MAVPTPEQLGRSLSALEAAFAGGTPVEFTPDGEVLHRPEARNHSRGGTQDAVAVVRTSGSTGTPKHTVLTATSLQASATASAELIGQGQWLVAVGTQFVAGLAVLSRSILAGTTPVPVAKGSFHPEAFLDAAGALDRAQAHYVSLVPTQLGRLLAGNPSEQLVELLQSFSGILVGGAAIPAPLVKRAKELNLNLFLTYGSSETSGGCVYNGLPLPGVTVDTVSSAQHRDVQRVRLAGPVVAAGYLDNPRLTNEHFDRALDGMPRYLTDDEGTLTRPAPGEPPVLTLGGRIDDVIISGGLKFSAGTVQRVLEAVPGVAQAVVTGIPDPEWGQRVAAVLVCAHHGSELLDDAAETVRQQLGSTAVPKTWRTVAELPLLPNGKPDRRALVALLTQQD